MYLNVIVNPDIWFRPFTYKLFDNASNNLHFFEIEGHFSSCHLVLRLQATVSTKKTLCNASARLQTNEDDQLRIYARVMILHRELTSNENQSKIEKQAQCRLNCNCSRVGLKQGCTACGREIVLQNARCGGRALIKIFCYVTVRNSYDLLTVTLI